MGVVTEGGAGGELSGRTAVVTGASRGIGLAIARELSAAGAWVVMVARGEAALRDAAAELRAHAVPMDVSVPAAVNALVAYLDDLLGDTPDIVVNAAGVFSLARVADTDPAEFDRHLAVNLRGPFLLIRAFLPGMLRRGSGSLVTIGSVAGRVPLPGNAAYGASKYGLRGLHEVLSEEVRGTGVRTTLIEPAATDTPLWDPLDPDANPELPSRAAMLRPEDVARAVRYAVSQPPGVEVGVLALRAT